MSKPPQQPPDPELAGIGSQFEATPNNVDYDGMSADLKEMPGRHPPVSPLLREALARTVAADIFRTKLLNSQVLADLGRAHVSTAEHDARQ
ncbi:hypothetical protein F4779DRAFT_614089 [Xylariaceae sp. FL0662B]|nr:hypothetical protein F4779DRAFT_614089 [Xylariaceae sp. FL0662B]